MSSMIVLYLSSNCLLFVLYVGASFASGERERERGSEQDRGEIDREKGEGFKGIESDADRALPCRGPVLQCLVTDRIALWLGPSCARVSLPSSDACIGKYRVFTVTLVVSLRSTSRSPSHLLLPLSPPLSPALLLSFVLLIS